MDEFEAHRGRLRAVAYRMLGSAAEAEDAVQEAWIRFDRTDTTGVGNLAGWLTTVVSRICLDHLRARAARAEEPWAELPEQVWESDPEQEAVLVDAVGRALLVVLDALSPHERVAFVLHDLFAVPFDEIAPVVDRSVVATKKLASRARHRIQGTPTVSRAERERQRAVVEAFLAASRTGDLDGLLAVLAPDVVRRADASALPPGRATVARGSDIVARETAGFGRRSRFAATAMIDGRVGAVVAPFGKLLIALSVTVEEDRITGYEVISEPARLRALKITVFDDFPLSPPK
ncbi:sigma-70 family RNA polymerase sigma factor [Amycolatopsis acidicola]|uniref:Sigma-70 family RNA polymerase sigma factor n=1 Tax=Amycolatopsis acidicola TaxID=2596893 RepID=A0A5N0UW34_9PSEU|nr:sigma-70 family RNA polymerase sigma factor [Amycolatopsis acidicola]KAA9153166.1 sigma-70 family RNA polymerase sigma factor [Amycolatopsis acidicola]